MQKVQSAGAVPEWGINSGTWRDTPSAFFLIGLFEGLRRSAAKTKKQSTNVQRGNTKLNNNHHHQRKVNVRKNVRIGVCN